jgi:hypothetical protein
MVHHSACFLHMGRWMCTCHCFCFPFFVSIEFPFPNLASDGGTHGRDGQIRGTVKVISNSFVKDTCTKHLLFVFDIERDTGYRKKKRERERERERESENQYGVRIYGILSVL